MNYMKTTLLLAGLTALFGAIGYMVGGQGGMMIALLMAAAMNVFSWWNSGAMVLRMHNAQPVSPAEAPNLYRLTEELAHRAGLPMPKLYIIHENQPNAFATGRNPQNAAVAVNTGLMDLLSDEEIAGVIAHELAHVHNRDTLTMTITATLAGAISMIAQMGQFGMMFGGNRDGENRPNPIVGILMMVLAPMAAMLVQMAISRTREYSADKLGAELCGNPLALASALQKLDNYARRIPNEAAEAAPATAHMFIINPLTGRNMDNLFTTHPATENRIHALREQAAQMGVIGPTPWSSTPPQRPQAPPPANPWA